MSHQFECAACHTKQKSRGIEHDRSTGNKYLECEKCGAKNELIQLPTSSGAPLEFKTNGKLLK